MLRKRALPKRPHLIDIIRMYRTCEFESDVERGT